MLINVENVVDTIMLDDTVNREQAIELVNTLIKAQSIEKMFDVWGVPQQEILDVGKLFEKWVEFHKGEEQDIKDMAEMSKHVKQIVDIMRRKNNKIHVVGMPTEEMLNKLQEEAKSDLEYSENIKTFYGRIKPLVDLVKDMRNAQDRT